MSVKDNDERGDTEIVKIMGISYTDRRMQSRGSQNRGINRVKTGTAFYNDRFTILKPIGSGGFGNVYCVVDKSSPSCEQLRALKIIQTNRKTNPRKYHEINVSEYISKIPAPESVRKLFVKMNDHFSYKDHVFIIYELLGLSLGQVMRKNKNRGFVTTQLRKIAEQLAKALSFLHENGIVHMDVKPDNIVLVTSDFEINASDGRIAVADTTLRLIDFGSTILPEDDKTKASTTVSYAAPEVFLGGVYSSQSDVWSLGCTLFECYTGHKPFSGQPVANQCYQIEAILCESIPAKFAMRSKLSCFNEEGCLIYGTNGTHVCKQIHEKVKPLLEYNKDPNSSSTNALFDLLKQMLSVNYESRISCEGILEHDFIKTIQNA